MQTLPGRPESFWIETARAASFPPLDRDESFDVAVLGAGITGVTAALLLKREGSRVALVEADRVGRGVSGHPTAKVTSQHSLTYSKLESSFGKAGAAAYGEANEAGLDLIARLAEELGIDCDLRRKPAYTWTEPEDQRETLEQEARAAREAGLPASFTAESDLPWPIVGAVRSDQQAEFHPVKYLLPLAQAVAGEGSEVFEHTRAVAVRDGEPCRVKSDRGPTLHARHGSSPRTIRSSTAPGSSPACTPSAPTCSPCACAGRSHRGCTSAPRATPCVPSPTAAVSCCWWAARATRWPRPTRRELPPARAMGARALPHRVDRLPLVEPGQRLTRPGALRRAPGPFSKRVLGATGYRKWGYANGAAAAPCSPTQCSAGPTRGRRPSTPTAWARRRPR